MTPDISGGESTDNFDLDAPQEYDDFATAYYDLLDKVDAGLMVVGESESDLNSLSILGSNQSDVLGFSKDNGEFYLSDSSGVFTALDISVDFSNLTSQEITDLTNALDGNFLLLSGGTMEGDIDMNGNNVNNASTVEAQDEMILPIK